MISDALHGLGKAVGEVLKVALPWLRKETTKQKSVKAVGDNKDLRRDIDRTIREELER